MNTEIPKMQDAASFCIYSENGMYFCDPFGASFPCTRRIDRFCVFLRSFLFSCFGLVLTAFFALFNRTGMMMTEQKEKVENKGDGPVCVDEWMDACMC